MTIMNYVGLLLLPNYSMYLLEEIIDSCRASFDKLRDYGPLNQYFLYCCKNIRTFSFEVIVPVALIGTTSLY